MHRLTRLGLDRVDLYQVHAFDPLTPLEETLRTLDGFIRAGKINYYGLSNFTGWQLTKTVHVANALGVAAPVTLQPQYSLIVREIEWEVVPAVQDAGMGMLPWSPLGGGWLSGKYRRDERPTGDTRLGDDPGRGMEAYERRGTDRTWNIIDAVQKVAEDRGVSMAEVALAWVSDQPAVTSTILGARTTEQLATNLKAVDLHLTPRRARPGRRPAICMRPTTRTARWESISVAAPSQATERSAVRPGGREDHVGVKPKRSRRATVDIEHVRVVSLAWLSGCITVGNDHHLTTIRRPARFLLDSGPGRNRANAGAICAASGRHRSCQLRCGAGRRSWCRRGTTSGRRHCQPCGR